MRCSEGFQKEPPLSPPILHPSKSNVLSIISGMKDDADRITLWNTAAILLLEIRFAGRRDEWEGVVRKSRVWLEKMTAESRPAIEDQPLEAWLRKYLEKNLRVPVL